MNKSLSAIERTEKLIEAMSLDQKFHMIHGGLGRYIGNVPAIPELSIPSINLEDGP
jgi:hypothetical protein